MQQQQLNDDEDVMPLFDVIQRRRRSRLIDSLERIGLELRDDSKLCRTYITTGIPPVDEVVFTMEEMRWYYSQTQYQFTVMNIDHADDNSRRFGVEAGKKEARRRWLQDRLLNASSSINVEAVPFTMMITLVSEMYDVYIDLVSDVVLKQDNQYLYNCIIQAPRQQVRMEQTAKSIMMDMIPERVRRIMASEISSDYEDTIENRVYEKLKIRSYKAKLNELNNLTHHPQSLINLMQQQRQIQPRRTAKEWHEIRIHYYTANGLMLSEYWHVHPSYCKELFFAVTDKYKKHQ